MFLGTFKLKTFEKLQVNYNFIAGTYILVLFGAGSIAQSVLSLGHKGDFFSINWGYVAIEVVINKIVLNQ